MMNNQNIDETYAVSNQESWNYTENTHKHTYPNEQSITLEDI